MLTSKLFSACNLLHAGFLFDLLFDHEDLGDTLLGNVGATAELYSLTTQKTVQLTSCLNYVCL
jgi:hypothetical protein